MNTHPSQVISLIEILLETGGRRSIFDNTIIMWKKKSELIGIMCIHVDDLCFGGNEEFEEKVIKVIRKKTSNRTYRTKKF